MMCTGRPRPAGHAWLRLRPAVDCRNLCFHAIPVGTVASFPGIAGSVSQFL